MRRSPAGPALALLLPAPAALWRQGPAPGDGAGGGTVAITGVTVLDVVHGRRVPAQTVVVRGARLAAVGPAARVPVPAGAPVVDGRGRFLIPGLWDMHVHFMNTGIAALPLLVANGVTGVREMGGHLDSTRAWQRRMAAGELVGPRVHTAGPILESPRYVARVRERDRRAGGGLAPLLLPYRIGVTDSAHAERVVDSRARLGVDFVKSRNTLWSATTGPAHYFGPRHAPQLAGERTLVPARQRLTGREERGVRKRLRELDPVRVDGVERYGGRAILRSR